MLEISGSLASTVGKKNPFRYRGYYYDSETELYYVSSRYYDSELRRFISTDTTDILDIQSDLYNKNLYAYCDNNPVIRLDENGDMWELAVIGTVAVSGVVSVAIKYTKTKSETKSGTKDRVTSPIGRRNNYNSRKKAKEAAKKAGGGKKPIKHPKGYHGNKRPHYHTNVKNNYRVTPKGISSHDHYYYPR